MFSWLFVIVKAFSSNHYIIKKFPNGESYQDVETRIKDLLLEDKKLNLKVPSDIKNIHKLFKKNGKKLFIVGIVNGWNFCGGSLGWPAGGSNLVYVIEANFKKHAFDNYTWRQAQFIWRSVPKLFV